MILRLVPTDFALNRWLVFYLVSGVLSLVWSRSEESVYRAALRLTTLTVLFSHLTDVLMIITLVEMGNGFLFCLAQARTGLQKSIRYVTVVSCAIFGLLAIAMFGVTTAEYTRYLSDWYYSYYDDDLYVASRRLSNAFQIIMFVWALLILVFAAVVFHKAKRNYVLKNVSRTIYFMQHW